MARTHGFRFTRTIDAPVEAVWALLSDHAGYSTWTAMPASRLETPGQDDPNGVGAVRFLGVGGVGVREQIHAFEPNRHLAYGVISGLPVRGHRADVRLTDADGRTELEYAGSFEPTVPGSGMAIAQVMRTAIQTLMRSLDKAATRR